MSGEQDLTAQIVVEAQDRASGIIKTVSRELGVFGSLLAGLATSGGLAGLGIATLLTAIATATHVGLKVADEVEQLDLLATRTGVSVEALQVLRQQVREMGGDAETLTLSLQFLNRAIATQDPLLKALGITTTNTFDAFTQLSDAFGASSDTGKKTEIAYQLLGRGAGPLLGILPKLSASFDETRASMEAAGGVMTGSVLVSARALDEESDRLGRSWSSLMTGIRASTLPTANAVVQALNDMWNAMSGQRNTPQVEQDRLIQRLQTQVDTNRKAAVEMRKRGSDSLADEYEGIVAKLELQLGKLKGVRAETEDEETSILNALDHAAAGKRDVVSGVTLGKKAEKTPREEQLERIMRALGQTRAEAELTMQSLDRIGDAKFAEGIREQLTLGPAIPAELLAYNAEVTETARLLGVSTEEAAGFVDQLKILSDEAKAADLLKQLFPDERSMGEQLAVVYAKMLEFKAVVGDALEAVYQGATRGFEKSFREIAAGTATLGSTLKNLWSGIVDSIISMLARLAAAMVVLGVISFATGIPIGTLANIANAGSRVTAAGADTMAVAGIGQAASGGNTINVYGYDNHSLVADLLSPSGKMRAANDRLFMLSEY